MKIGIELLEQTDWSSLLHAYGRATDTPKHLRALIDGNKTAKNKALEHLSGSVLHQGTPFPATAPAALVIAGIFLDNPIDQWDWTPEDDINSFHARLIRFLLAVATTSMSPDMKSMT